VLAISELMLRNSVLAADTTPDTARLTCFVRGVPDPIAPTDSVTFKGSDAWVTVGINRKLGGVAVKLSITNPEAPTQPLDLVEARSAGGAAWQTTVTVADAEKQRIIHFNQAAGNSAANWGFEAAYNIDPATGLSQQEWLPLYSNDYRSGLGFDAPDVATSPCPGSAPAGIPKYEPSLRFGDGKLNISPSLIAVGASKVLRLTDSYSIRSVEEKKWKWLEVEQALYMTVAAVRTGAMRVYVKPRDGAMIGGIDPLGDPPESLKGRLRNVEGTSDDWFLSTLPASYAVLVFNVAGKDIGIAVHSSDNRAFTGFLRIRRHPFCRQNRDDCGNIQWHSYISSRFDPSVQSQTHAGAIMSYAIDYDIAPVTELAAAGFRLN
jgi:hypothetical protein